eukprot:365913-Chlamydomonas_euryale.AAC.6
MKRPAIPSWIFNPDQKPATRLRLFISASVLSRAHVWSNARCISTLTRALACTLHMCWCGPVCVWTAASSLPAASRGRSASAAEGCMAWSHAPSCPPKCDSNCRSRCASNCHSKCASNRHCGYVPI